MPASELAKAIDDGMPVIVLSPHLDDAALSCGALMMYAAARTSVTVASIFTEGGEPPYTLSARRYLHQVKARSAQALYEQRRAEDYAALEPFGIECVHAGLTEALYRRRPQAGPVPLRARLLPELAYVYPVYRRHVTGGRIAGCDTGTLREVSALIASLAVPGPKVVLAPLAVGRHVDHLLVRTAAERSGIHVMYYSDFPYNCRNPVEESFVLRNGLAQSQWHDGLGDKVSLIKAYKTQAAALFQDGHIPRIPEIFFSASTVQTMLSERH